MAGVLVLEVDWLFGVSTTGAEVETLLVGAMVDCSVSSEHSVSTTGAEIETLLVGAMADWSVTSERSVAIINLELLIEPYNLLRTYREGFLILINLYGQFQTVLRTTCTLEAPIQLISPLVTCLV